MKRIPIPVLLSALTAAILLADIAPAKACCLFNWWGGYGSTYSAGYAPSYSAGYAPSYSAGYAPSYTAAYSSTYSAAYAPYYSAAYVPTYSAYYAPTYSASYLPSTSYYGGSVSSTASACCNAQTTYSVPSTCCAPCTSCVSSCSDCSSGNCDLASSSSSSPTPVTPRSEGSQGGNPTFIEEEEPGSGSQYENNPMDQGTGDGFTPRAPGASNDPREENLGNVNTPRETLQFKIPEAAPVQEEDAKIRPVNRIGEPADPELNLDDKITSRPTAQRTRLISRRSWEQPVIAKNLTREAPAENLGWVPVPLPTQLVQK